MQKKFIIFFTAAVLFVFSCTHQPSVQDIIPISSMVNLTSTCAGCPSSPVCPITDDVLINTSSTYKVCAPQPSGQGVYELNDNYCLVWTPSDSQTEIVTTCIVVCTGKVCDTTLITIFPPVPSDTVQTGIKCSQDTVYFENDILPIISASCAYAGCHNEITAADGVRLYNYGNIINTGKVKAFKPSDSKLYEVITESKAKDIMPPPPAAKLTTLQINMIGKWITQGAKNNKCNENPGSCNTENVSFTTYIKPALASCTTCHKTGNTGGGINLDSYQGFKTAAYTPNAREAASFLKENFVPLKDAGILKYIDVQEGISFSEHINLSFVNGHTEAMMIPYIALPSGNTLIYCADLIPSHHHIPLPYIMAYDVRPLESLKEKQALHERAADGKHFLFFEHDLDLACGSLIRTETGKTAFGKSINLSDII